MPIWLSAGLWAGLGASSLLLGAAAAYLLPIRQRARAAIMAFGCGVLISAVAYDLLEDGFQEGGIWPIVIGALIGSMLYAAADEAVSRAGGHARKRSHADQPQEAGLAVAIGSLLDGIPESIVLGVGIAGGEGVSAAMLAAILLSNFPEGLSSASGMRKAGRSALHIFGLWTGIVAISTLAASAGALALAGAAPSTLATVNAIAAGGLLTMVVNTMIPEAVAGEHKATGVLAVMGLLVAFALTNLGGL
ncbi:ZIP family metal transporter [Rhodobacter sp. NSM]|uniref:ZIP family metal transporter n=1 Tax=Rhodobacter sp. NSM TaxID=3457501 RepID=UPI003FCFCE11